jgi:hypothetical protein
MFGNVMGSVGLLVVFTAGAGLLASGLEFYKHYRKETTPEVELEKAQENNDH